MKKMEIQINLQNNSIILPKKNTFQTVIDKITLLKILFWVFTRCQKEIVEWNNNNNLLMIIYYYHKFIF